MIDRSACHVKQLRIALDGCYPSFWATDLVMRIIRSRYLPVQVSRLSSYDLIIQGPFVSGNRKRRLFGTFFDVLDSFRPSNYLPISLHVSSENESLPNYQSFEQSNCNYGIGHEILKCANYFRTPHWYNYIDFSDIGIGSLSYWPRLGKPINLTELTNPIHWNKSGLEKAAFVVSNMTSQRQYLLSSLAKILPVDGFGKAFDPAIKNHSQSGFVKRDLLKKYKYCLCPENSISPGYYTEKIPEAYISGSIPISYCEPSMVKLDFSPLAFINLFEFYRDSKVDYSGLYNAIYNLDSLDRITKNPLIDYDLQLKVDALKNFILEICLASLA